MRVSFFAANGLTRSRNLLLAHASTIDALTISCTMFVRMCFVPPLFLLNSETTFASQVLQNPFSQSNLNKNNKMSK